MPPESDARIRIIHRIRARIGGFLAGLQMQHFCGAFADFQRSVSVIENLDENSPHRTTLDERCMVHRF
jgi:hypothetical protein